MVFSWWLIFSCAVAATAEKVKSKSDYCTIDKRHSLCLYSTRSTGPRCSQVSDKTVTDAEKAEILRLHNEKRSLVATGGEERGRPGPQHRAANMMELVWDDELAAIAQAWVNQCRFSHDCNQCREVGRFGVGQNLYGGGHSAGWKRAVDGWYNEVDDVDRKLAKKFRNVGGVGHYTQIVWATTTHIGCGRIKFGSGRNAWQYFFCNYGKGGNFLGRQMYEIGKECSACPSGTKCSNDYAGLCAGTPTDFTPSKHSKPTKPKEDPRPNPGAVSFLSGDGSSINGGNSNGGGGKGGSGGKGGNGGNGGSGSKGGGDGSSYSTSDGVCSFSCSKDETCQVRFEPHPNAIYSGNVLGSCYPKWFKGGECAGIPEPCSDCHNYCESKKKGGAISSGGNKGKEEKPHRCKHTCKKNGGCSVEILRGSGTYSGVTFKSCVPPGWGNCRRGPAGCDTCREACGSKRSGTVIVPLRGS